MFRGEQSRVAQPNSDPECCIAEPSTKHGKEDETFQVNDGPRLFFLNNGFNPFSLESNKLNLFFVLNLRFQSPVQCLCALLSPEL